MNTSRARFSTDGLQYCEPLSVISQSLPPTLLVASITSSSIGFRIIP